MILLLLEARKPGPIGLVTCPGHRAPEKEPGFTQLWFRPPTPSSKCLVEMAAWTGLPRGPGSMRDRHQAWLVRLDVAGSVSGRLASGTSTVPTSMPTRDRARVGAGTVSPSQETQGATLQGAQSQPGPQLQGGVPDTLPALGGVPRVFEEADLGVQWLGLGLAEKALCGGHPRAREPRDSETGLSPLPLLPGAALKQVHRPGSPGGAGSACGARSVGTWALGWRERPGWPGAWTYVVFLTLQLLRKLVLVGLQLVQGVPQLLGLVPGKRPSQAS